MTSKTYILQKDLPGAKVGDRFVQSPVNSEFYRKLGEEFNTLSEYHKAYIESFPEWFLPEENFLSADMIIETPSFRVAVNRKDKEQPMSVENMIEELMGYLPKLIQHKKDSEQKQNTSDRIKNVPHKLAPATPLDWRIISNTFAFTGTDHRPFAFRKENLTWEEAKPYLNTKKVYRSCFGPGIHVIPDIPIPKIKFPDGHTEYWMYFYEDQHPKQSDWIVEDFPNQTAGYKDFGQVNDQKWDEVFSGYEQHLKDYPQSTLSRADWMKQNFEAPVPYSKSNEKV